MFFKAGRVLSVEEFTKLNEKTPTDHLDIESPIVLEKNQENDKWYLPKLFLNDLASWPSQPLENRKHLTPEVGAKTCLQNCCGIEGLKSACCTLDPDDIEHVLGPLDEDDITRLINYFQKNGINFRRSDIAIDYEEGKLIGERFFNGHKVFESKDSYPMLRFQVAGPRFACKFMNSFNGKCTLYKDKVQPEFCKRYYCSYLKSNFLIRSKTNPNTWIKIY